MLAAAFAALALAAAACSGTGGGEPTTSAPLASSPPAPTTAPLPPTSAPAPPTTPGGITPTDVAAWVATWKGALQQVADDLSAAVRAARARDLDALRDALGSIPGDTQEAIAKLGDPTTAPGGLGEDVRGVELLLNQATAAARRLKDDCLGTPGVACMTDVAELVGMVAQLMHALQPLGVNIEFHVGG
ncbi:MAG TPA: hypothetical protein VID47_02000 [Actinomycetota bacterium]|jgi:hypothetical protein